VDLQSLVALDLDSGDLLETAMIGPPVGGLIDLLVGNDHVLWRPDDRTGLAGVVGFGLIARTLREADRYREVAVVGPDRSSILILPRLTSNDGTHGARQFTGAVVEAEEGREHGRRNEVWDEFGRWLTDVFIAASTRSEFIAIEMHTPDLPAEPYALALAMTEDDPGIIHLESSTRPVGAVMWPPGEDPEGQTISAPLGGQNLDVVGPILADAVRTWSDSAYDVAVTFCPVNQRPLVIAEV
jgi:hypothetical protein